MKGIINMPEANVPIDVEAMAPDGLPSPFERPKISKGYPLDRNEREELVNTPVMAEDVQRVFWAQFVDLTLEQAQQLADSYNADPTAGKAFRAALRALDAQDAKAS
jgi:hypothetical protein